MYAHVLRGMKQEVISNGHEGETIQKLLETKQALNRTPFLSICLPKKQILNLQNIIFQAEEVVLWSCS